jgi:hypothetical protein
VTLANRKWEGSDLAAIATSVRRVGDLWIPSGTTGIRVPVESQTSPIGNEIGWLHMPLQLQH